MLWPHAPEPLAGLLLLREQGSEGNRKAATKSSARVLVIAQQIVIFPGVTRVGTKLRPYRALQEGWPEN